MDIQSILKIDFVKILINEVCGDNTQLVVRENSFAVRSCVEGERDVHRIILLPPRGYTANAINQMNSHDEASYATIEVKGSIREGRNGFSKLKNCLLVASRDENGEVSSLNQPYLTYDLREFDPNLTIKKHSAGSAPFTVVKNDGFGFYHNLINFTNEWLVLQLHKQLRPQKSVDLEPHLKNIALSHASILRNLYDAIVEHGDGIFKKYPGLVADVTSLPPTISLPALGEMLYVHDSGMHEACTAFAVILKIGNQHPEKTSEFLRRAMTNKDIPTYYAEQLLGKIHKATESKQLETAIA